MIEKLELLHMQSVDVLLHSSRNQISMIKTLLPTGQMQTASSFLRVVIATAMFLAEVPTNEQGYPYDTVGGHGWTWEVKQREVGVCIDALYQLGWAWGDVHDVLEGVAVSMERMTPKQETLDAYTTPVPVERIAKQLQKEAEDGERVIREALCFWAPE